jgi:hypothetical protein
MKMLTRYCYVCYLNDEWDTKNTVGWSHEGGWLGLYTWYRNEEWEVERISNSASGLARFIISKGNQKHYVVAC